MSWCAGWFGSQTPALADRQRFSALAAHTSGPSRRLHQSNTAKAVSASVTAGVILMQRCSSPVTSGLLDRAVVPGRCTLIFYGAVVSSAQAFQRVLHQTCQLYLKITRYWSAAGTQYE